MLVRRPAPPHQSVVSAIHKIHGRSMLTVYSNALTFLVVAVVVVIVCLRVTMTTRFASTALARRAFTAFRFSGACPWQCALIVGAGS